MLEEAAVCEEGSSIQLLIAIASVILITAGHNDDAEIYSRFFLLCPLVDSLYIVSRAESRLDAIAFLFLILSICLSLCMCIIVSHGKRGAFISSICYDVYIYTHTRISEASYY